MKALFALLIIYFPTLLFAQSFPQDRVYGGLKHIYTLNGMSRSEQVYYFRTDGSFVDELSDKNWKEKISGHYRYNGKEVILDYTDSEYASDTLSFDDTHKDILWSGGLELIEMTIPNSLPVGYYEYSNATGSGGIGTGTVYVGNHLFDSLFILDKNHFTRDISSVATVSGNHVGGGTANKNQSSGTYQIKNGLLTLNYNNGKVEKISLFYSTGMLSNPDEDFMVALDGSISFYKTMKAYLAEKSE